MKQRKMKFSSRGERNRFFKYGTRLMTLQVWKCEYVAARLVLFARGEWRNSKNPSITLKPQTNDTKTD